MVGGCRARLTFNEVGSRIIVTNEVGEIVILVGVATAARSLNAPKEQKPTLTLRHGPSAKPANHGAKREAIAKKLGIGVAGVYRSARG